MRYQFVVHAPGWNWPIRLDELLAGYEKPEDLLGEDGLFKQLKNALLERALGAELTHDLGYEKGDPTGRGSGNNRDGSYPKTVLRSTCNGAFEPQIVPKGETRLDGFDDGSDHNRGEQRKRLSSSRRVDVLV